MLTDSKIDRAYYVLRLLQTKGIGQVKARQIIETCKRYFISLEEMFREIDNGALLPAIIMKYAQALKSKDEGLDKQWEQLAENQIDSIIYDEDDYPKSLLDVLKQSSPVILFYRGNWSILEKTSVGFCGSRNASEKGLDTARDCADQLTRKGINIISGYAKGVDMTVHISALAAGGVTTLVLAEGILNFKVKKEFLHNFDLNRTLIISEFLPASAWSVGHAMQRNTTICALSNLIILIEAHEKGGSFDAGKKCLAMGRPLFTPVYSGMPESAIGNRILLNEGAQGLMRSRLTGKADLRALNILFVDQKQTTCV
ncbi:MAG: DNA-protecting protein DprA [Nitrospirae bacterium]|nr:DNA-protecting protein DprA [Nitrospirota bacterium]MBF0591645.1 DNA-protecting protein DprA [Nitrospirota bacterium]